MDEAGWDRNRPVQTRMIGLSKRTVQDGNIDIRLTGEPQIHEFGSTAASHPHHTAVVPFLSFDASYTYATFPANPKIKI